MKPKCTPSVDVVVNGKVTGAIIFDNQDQFNRYINGFVEKQTIDFSKTSYKKKIITFNG